MPFWFRPQPGFLARPQSVPVAVRSPAGVRGCCCWGQRAADGQSQQRLWPRAGTLV